MKKKKKSISEQKEKNRKENVRRKGKISRFIKNSPPADFGIIALTAGLMIFGVIMVFSASYYWSMDQYGKPYGYLVRSGAWAVIGAVAMYITSYIDYRIYKKFYKQIFWISIILLVALITTPLGVEIKGATRWLNIGITTIMPGEIAKIAAIIFTAGMLSRNRVNVNDLKKTIIPLLAVSGAYGFLIMKQPNMSTAATVVLIILAMMFVSGIKYKYFLSLIAMGAGAGVLILIIGGGYRMQRVLSFLDPFEDPRGDSFQVVQSLLALGSGGLFGRGLGNGVQKTLYLPEPMNDFILAIIGEELGFVGILVLIMVFSLLIWRGITVALKAPDKFGFFIASGVTMLIGIQFAMNIAIVTSSMPPTGVALPFISYGGNAMLIFCIGIGMVLNVSRQAKKKENLDKIVDAKRDRVVFTRNRGAR